MSLTNFISIPEIKHIFRQSFEKPRLELRDVEPICPLLTNHYSLIGKAFDYLLRFYIKANNPNAIEKPWIAEKSVELSKTYPDLFKKLIKC